VSSIRVHVLSILGLTICYDFPEFIHLISSEANEICEQESKKTIAPEHIIGALKVCCAFVPTFDF